MDRNEGNCYIYIVWPNSNKIQICELNAQFLNSTLLKERLDKNNTTHLWKPIIPAHGKIPLHQQQQEKKGRGSHPFFHSSTKVEVHSCDKCTEASSSPLISFSIVSLFHFFHPWHSGAFPSPQKDVRHSVN